MFYLLRNVLIKRSYNKGDETLITKGHRNQPELICLYPGNYYVSAP